MSRRASRSARTPDTSPQRPRSRSWRLSVAFIGLFTLAACGESEAVTPPEEDARVTEARVEDSGQPDVCEPACDGRSCGDNGCGGICGTCAATESCSDTGLCLCDPSSRDCETPDQACTEDIWEPDNSFEEAHEVTGLNGTQSATTRIPAPGNSGLSICPKGDVDWVEIQLKAPQSMEITVTPSTDVPMDLTFLPGEGSAEVALEVTQTPGGGVKGSAASIGPGTYYVGISAFSAQDTSQTVSAYTFAASFE